MSHEAAPQDEHKRRTTSKLFLAVVIILGVIGYFKGEAIMTYAMYLQEQWIQSSKVERDKQRDRLAGPPPTSNISVAAPSDAEQQSAAPVVPSVDPGAEVPSAPEEP